MCSPVSVVCSCYVWLNGSREQIFLGDLQDKQFSWGWKQSNRMSTRLQACPTCSWQTACSLTQLALQPPYAIIVVTAPVLLCYAPAWPLSTNQTSVHYYPHQVWNQVIGCSVVLAQVMANKFTNFDMLAKHSHVNSKTMQLCFPDFEKNLWTVFKTAKKIFFVFFFYLQLPFHLM